ncbi:MAG: fatty acid desaturase family protein, partial [Ignavibacteria bacterium]
MNHKAVKFSNDMNTDIYGILKRRVKEYFDVRNIPRHGNSVMVWKTIFMISLYVAPYILMFIPISIGISNTLIIFGLWIVMGFGMAGIGLSVMHDANHRAYSGKAKVNKYLGYLMNVIGGSAVNWKIQHNVLHHSFTNIHGLDEDLGLGKLLRFSPNQKRYKVHRLQHFYAWFFYCLLTLSRVTWKDVHQLFRYKRKGLIKVHNKTFKGLFVELITSKMLYGFYFIVIPMMFLGIPWWQILLFFLSMHFVAGIILGCVFQCAHVMPASEYPVPDGNGNLENDWALHQLFT